MSDIQKMKQAALEALDNMDDYARMAVSIEPIGALNHLTDFINTVCARLESAERDAARWKAFVAEAERDYVEVSASEEPYYQRFECAAAMEEFADAAIKESK